MFPDVQHPMLLDRWHIFLKWAHARKYVVNLYRPVTFCGKYCDYRIQLMMKVGKMPVTFEVKEDTLDKAISGIKEKLLAFKPGEK